MQLEPNFVSLLKQKVYPIIGCCQTVHKLMGPFLNEYMYQEALKIEMDRMPELTATPEYYFSVQYRGQQIRHKHYVDFMVRNGNDEIFVECKAVEHLGDEQRQQLWNYMRLTETKIGVLYNFAPIMAQCEKYYYDKTTKEIRAF